MYCAACGLTGCDFSNNQLRKGDGRARCRRCVDEQLYYDDFDHGSSSRGFGAAEGAVYSGSQNGDGDGDGGLRNHYDVLEDVNGRLDDQDDYQLITIEKSEKADELEKKVAEMTIEICKLKGRVETLMVCLYDALRLTKQQTHILPTPTKPGAVLLTPLSLSLPFPSLPWHSL